MTCSHIFPFFSFSPPLTLPPYALCTIPHPRARSSTTAAPLASSPTHGAPPGSSSHLFGSPNARLAWRPTAANTSFRGPKLILSESAIAGRYDWHHCYECLHCPQSAMRFGTLVGPLLWPVVCFDAVILAVGTRSQQSRSLWVPGMWPCSLLCPPFVADPVTSPQPGYGVPGVFRRLSRKKGSTCSERQSS